MCPVYCILFLTAAYLFYNPQYLLVLFFQSFKLVLIVYQQIMGCVTRLSVWKRKAKRKILLQTKTFDNRPVMKPPSLSKLPPKKF